MARARVYLQVNLHSDPNYNDDNCIKNYKTWHKYFFQYNTKYNKNLKD